CERLGAPPVWVGVAGRMAPILHGQMQRYSALDDDALFAEALAIGGSPEHVAAIPELRARFLRVVRADLALLESYEAAPDRALLGCPVTAFAGTSDQCAPPTTMRPWARETRGEFHQRLYAGGHFFFLGQPFAGFVRDVVREIAPHLAARVHSA